MKYFTCIIVVALAACTTACEGDKKKAGITPEATSGVIPPDCYPPYINPVEVRPFPAKVATLKEAVLAAACNGFVPDSILGANMYSHKGANYVLRLTNNTDSLDRYYADEELEVTVTPDGFVKTRSLAVYNQSSHPRSY